MRLARKELAFVLAACRSLQEDLMDGEFRSKLMEDGNAIGGYFTEEGLTLPSDVEIDLLCESLNSEMLESCQECLVTPLPNQSAEAEVRTEKYGTLCKTHAERLLDPIEGMDKR